MSGRWGWSRGRVGGFLMAAFGWCGGVGARRVGRGGWVAVVGVCCSLLRFFWDTEVRLVGLNLHTRAFTYLVCYRTKAGI